MDERKSKMSKSIVQLTGRLALIVLFLISLSYLPNDALYTSQAKINGESIDFKLNLPSSKVCIHSCLRVEAEITNSGDKDVVIDTRSLRYRLTANYLMTLKDGAFSRTWSRQGDYGPNQYDEDHYLVLKTGKSYKTELIFSLKDRFFQDLGSYKVKLTYGQFRSYIFRGVNLFKGVVKSNEVEFNIVQCSPEETKKTLPNCQ